MTRLGVLGAAVLLAAVGVVPMGPSLARTPPAAVSWLNAGDSFSSGEGMTDASLLDSASCAQSQLAYGEQAVAILTKRGWSVPTHEFVACTGATLREFYGHGDKANKGRGPQWTQATKQSGRDRFDVITMSFGGNDIKFGDIVSKCLIYPTNRRWWIDLIDLVPEEPRCDITYEQITDAIDTFVGTTTQTTLLGGVGEVAEEVPQSLSNFYAKVARDSLTERGHLVVVGYPAILAPSSEWGDYRNGECESVTDTDANMLGAVAAYLDNALLLAVEEANRSLGKDRISYVSRRNLFRPHELCGTAKTWLVGFKGFNTGDRWRIQESFHVNEAGHLATAQAVADKVASAFGDAPDQGEVLGADTGPVYAFLTEEKLQVGLGAKVIATAPGPFVGLGEGWSPEDSFHFTDDGRFVFAVSNVSGTGTQGGDPRIVAIEVATGKVRQVPCDGCMAAMPAGGSSVAFLPELALNASVPGTRVMRVDLSLSTAPRDVAPAERERLALVVAYDGRWPRLPVSAPSTVYGGPRVLAAVRDVPDSMESPEHVEILDPATGRKSVIGLPSDADWAPCQTAIDDLWWGRDAKPHLATRTVFCGGDDITPYPRHFWRLDGQSWTKTGGAPVGQLAGVWAIRDLPGGARVTLNTGGQFVDQCPRGSVSYESGGTATTITSSPCIQQVLGLRTPPSTTP